MTALVTAAVFGLVAVPSMPAAHTRSSDRIDRLATPEDVNAPRVACLRNGINERLATKDELARIREQLENPIQHDPLQFSW